MISGVMRNHTSDRIASGLDRRKFIGALAATAAGPAISASQTRAGRPPNVVLIITDDQGYGDLGCHGNDRLKTPHIDAMATQSVQFTHFYATPVCTPTRAGLMTGRYNFRTGAVDTYRGRAMMHAEEVTIAEALSSAGYRTGIFGKWHLGDNYPLRAMDQGFQESLVHRGGGIGQPSDPPGNSYFDPILLHNGRDVRRKGYCTDIFFDEAMAFIEKNRTNRFFAYVATNAPHTPLEVADDLVAPYRAMGLDETTAKVYAMVTNVDANTGRLLSHLGQLGIDRDTIVIFMTDNGPQQRRYNAGLRDLKGTVYDGGIRVPFYMRWPGTLEGGRKIDRIAATIDVFPTLLDACGAARPKGVALDGRNLMPLLRQTSPDWPDRTLFTQWHRGDVPEMGRACAARNQKYKLVQPLGTQEGAGPKVPKWELYDMEADPGETKNIANEKPEVARNLRKAYEDWFKDVSSTRGYDPPRIHVGAPQENPVTLTRQDWRGPRAAWGKEGVGHWEVRVARAGDYQVSFRFPKAASAGKAEFKFGDTALSAPFEEGATSVTFGKCRLPAGPGRVEAMLDFGKNTIGAHYVDVKRL